MIYQPREDSYLLERCVKKYSKGKSFLDMGSGSGIQSKAALTFGASGVLAVDINPQVISLLKKQNILCIKSNLFQKVKGNFDLIAFNPPYLPRDPKEDKESQLTTTGGKRGDEIILRFLKQAPEHLNKNGTILLLLSSLTPKDKIQVLLKKLSLKAKIIDSQNLFMETLEIWEIRETSSP